MATKGMKNRYTCQECGGQVVTIDSDSGVTPFAIACRVTKDCDGFMFSSFYQVDQSLKPQYEWFKPKSLKGYDEAMREHIKFCGS